MTNSDEPVVTVCGLKLNRRRFRNIDSCNVTQYSINTAQFSVFISQIGNHSCDCIGYVRVYEAKDQNSGTLAECIAWAQKRLPEMVQEADAAMDEVRRWIL